jgi:hypothetical protein
MVQIFLFIVSLFAGTTSAWATPPQELTPSYDLKNKILTVSVKHITKDLDKHYIRKIAVVVNGEEQLVEYYKRQPEYMEFSYDFDLDHPPGTVIAVKAYCSDGGTKEAQMVISVPEKSDDKPEETFVPAAVSAPVDEHKSSGY